MRVCILTPEFLPTWGGIGAYTYNLARGLRDYADVHVVTSESEGQHPDPRALEGVQVHSIHRGAKASAGLGIPFALAAFRRLPRLARTYRFDVIHSNHALMSDLFVRARRLSAPTVVTVHSTLGTQIDGTLRAGGLVPLDPRERAVAQWRYLFRSIERRYLRRTPAMIFVSRWVRDRAVARYHLSPRVSCVIPNGIDTHQLAVAQRFMVPEGGAAGRPSILFVGRLVALKGIETLLRAMVRLDSNIRLLLAGPGAPAPWRALARSLGLEETRYEFLGRVPYWQMADLYHRVDAVVLPSFSESCSMVALESMACGTPLIASSAGGTSEIVRDGDTGWLFPPGDVDELARRIETVLADPARARAVAARARTWVEENASVDRMVEHTLRFYEAAIGGAA